MSARQEINRGYVEYLRTISAPAPNSAQSPPRKSSFLKNCLRPVWRLVRPVLQFVRTLCMFVSLCVTACLLLLCLKVGGWFRRRPLPALHQEALTHIEKFVRQYPFHFYPLLCKTLELVYLRQSLAELATGATRVVELAIGDGTLSSKIYPEGVRIVALDISPYSLRSSAKMPHVARAVIADCLAPPLADGSFDLLVSNNFLHHVTDKNQTLENMAKIARQAIFNENTTYWASAWPRPFLLRKLGLHRMAERATARIADQALQSLKSRAEVDELIGRHYRVISSAAYFHEVTYFFCGVFSRLMGCYGPPMPADLKRFVLNTPLVNMLSLWLTTALARALVIFDASRDPAGAVFISYTCESVYTGGSSQGELVCPGCRVLLQSPPQCPQCNRDFDTVAGMCFVLPTELEFIRQQYVPGDVAVHTGSSQEHH